MIDAARRPLVDRSGSSAVYEPFQRFNRYASMTAQCSDDASWVQTSPASLSGSAWSRETCIHTGAPGWNISDLGLRGASQTQFVSSEEFSKAERARRAIALIDEWLADDSGYDEETWPELKKALDEDRLSYRKLFDE